MDDDTPAPEPRTPLEALEAQADRIERKLAALLDATGAEEHAATSATALLAEAEGLAESVGPPPGAGVDPDGEDDLAHWQERYAMAADMLASYADDDATAMRAAAMREPGPIDRARLLLLVAALRTEESRR